MRLSNFLIVASSAIVFSTALIYFAFQAIWTRSNEPTVDWQAQVEQLEAEKQSLIDEAAKSVLALNDEIKSLKRSLKQSEKLLTENDDEIAKLRSQVNSNELAMELASIINCEPSAVAEQTRRLINSLQATMLQLEIAQQQLAQLNARPINREDAVPGRPNGQDEVAKNPTGRQEPAQKEPAQNHPALNHPAQQNSKAIKAESGKSTEAQTRTQPRIKKFDLAGPENAQRANGASPIHSDAGNQPVQDKIASATTAEAARLLRQVEDLKLELKNREKLLFEQTSLIEDLKQKTQRIETDFRTPRGTTTPNSPFRDRGTFKVQ